jgi:hypothetical protein
MPTRTTSKPSLLESTQEPSYWNSVNALPKCRDNRSLIWIWIHIKVKSKIQIRIRIRIKETSRIRIRGKVMRIRNTAL